MNCQLQCDDNDDGGDDDDDDEEEEEKARWWLLTRVLVALASTSRFPELPICCKFLHSSAPAVVQ